MFANILKFEKTKTKKKTCTLVSFSDSSSYITMKAKIAFMPITIQRCIAAQWISVEFLSDAVMRGGDAAGQFVHTTGSTYMQRCCLSSLCSNKSLTLAKHHLTVPEVKLTGRLKRPMAVKQVCVSSLLLVIQTHSGQIKLLKKKKIYFHTGAVNDTKYANILTWLSAAKHLCLSVFGANVSFEWGMSAHTQILTRLPLTLCFSCVEGKAEDAGLCFSTAVPPPPFFYSEKIKTS